MADEAALLNSSSFLINGYMNLPSSSTITEALLKQAAAKTLSSTSVLALVNHISSRGPIFQDKDYPWVTLYREQYNILHQKLLNDLLDYYKTKNPIIYAGLLKDYHSLYQDAIF